MKYLLTMFIILAGIIVFILACDGGNKAKAGMGISRECVISNEYGIIYTLFYDGHQYIVHYRGGIIHSESCPCKRGK